MSLTLTIKRGGSGTATGSGTSITISGTIAGGTIEELKLTGDTTQNDTPTPTNKVDVNVVTGTQTITITDGNSQSTTKTVNLGTIELCKIGTYADYIYKSGSNWYVHRIIRKVQPNSSYNFDTLSGMARFAVSGMRTGSSAFLWSDRFVWQYANQKNYCYVSTASRIAFGVEGVSTVQQAKDWVDEYKPVFYGVRTSAIDEVITSPTLTAQLDDLLETPTYDTATTYSVSGSLASPLEMTVAKYVGVTYIESELSSPFTIADVEGKSQNTTLDGNIYVDFVYNKKQFSVDIFNLTPSDYAKIRGFYDAQFTTGQFPTISIPELNIENMVVFFEISSRNIVNQCLLTNKLTLKFRETVQP